MNNSAIESILCCIVGGEVCQQIAAIELKVDM